MNFRIDESDLRPLVHLVVGEVLDQVRGEEAKLNGRLGYSEAEAAALLGVRPHVLRDCRLRGEIKARMVGKRYIYARESLIRFLGEGASL